MEDAKNNGQSTQAPVPAGVQGSSTAPASDASIVVREPAPIVPPSASIPVPVGGTRATTSSHVREASTSSALPQKAESTLETTNPIDTPIVEESPDVALPELTPEQIQFFGSSRYKESEALLERTFALNSDDQIFLREMDHAVLGELITLSQYATAIREEFTQLNDAERDELLGILIAYRFMPWDIRPSAQDVAREFSLTLPKTPYYRIYTKPLTYRGAAHEVARVAGIEFINQRQERLRDLIISRVKGIRSDSQVEEQLMRSEEQGGLGLKKDVAHTAMESIADISSRAKLVTEDEYSDWLSRRIHEQQNVSTPIVATETVTDQTGLKAEEEEEIKQIINRMPPTERVQMVALAESVKTIYESLSYHPDDPYLMRRLMDAISTRLRDVRSKNELFMKLMRDSKVGGLGLTRDEAEKLVADIERGYLAHREKVATEEKKHIFDQLADQERKIEERKKREAAEHARWYEEKIKVKQSKETFQRSALEQLRNVIAQGQTTPIHPLEAKKEAQERASFGELVPVSKQTVASIEPQEPKVTTKPSVGMPMKKESIVKVSTETVKMQQSASSVRPKVEDVSVPRTSLSGPLQEIGGMTIDAFRRLAKTPAEASKKLQAKVALLAEESFEKRIQAIQAWQASPLQREYLSLLAKAFTEKKQVKQLVQEQHAVNEHIFTPEELDVIIALNAVLKL